MNILDDFEVQNESAIEPPKKKSYTTLLALLLAAVIAVACAHVISGANSIQVTTSDGVVYTATVVSSYEDGDIAVLKIEAEGLQTAVLGDSDKIQLAETVYAVGNPGGTLSGNITDGIISAKSRTISISIENGVGPYGLGINNRIVSLEVLQTNAAVSPGNSGGGLLNAQGELIGIVNAKSSGENQEGLGFAIPVNTVQEIAVVEIAPAAAHMNNREPGVYVQSVKEGGSSDGKLEVNDRFVSVNGYMIHTTAELSAQLAEHSPGDSVKLTVERNGRLEEMEVTLAKGE